MDEGARTINVEQRTSYPTVTREQHLESRNRLLSILVAILLVGYVALTMLYIANPQPVVVVNQDDKLVGEYRQSLFRSSEDFINGGIKFLSHHMSLNAHSITRDQELAGYMMTEKLREQQLGLVERENLIDKIEKLGWTSRIEVTDVEIVHADKNYTKVRYAGKRFVVDSRGKQKPVEDFSFLIDMEPVARSTQNDSGVRIIDFTSI